MVRCAVAHAGNDHRLGAQEAPPAIISLYPGTGFEEYVDSLIGGGELSGYKAETKLQSTGCSASMPIKANIEDRNRTAPFPFCGNRFEFRAVGSSQNCSFPVMVCNTIMAAGMAHMAGKIENGMSHRDAVAAEFKECKSVIFTGNGYSAEWPVEAASRGLPNLKNTPQATATWASDKNIKIFDELGIYSAEETKARAEIMYEAYVTTISVEAQTLIEMVDTAIIPACAMDMNKYKDFPKLSRGRDALYQSIAEENETLKGFKEKMPHNADLHEEATYCCETLKPQLEKIRSLVDRAEGLLEKGLYPFPNYQDLLYSHHH
jgi:glutamine synthetase